MQFNDWDTFFRAVDAAGSGRDLRWIAEGGECVIKIKPGDTVTGCKAGDLEINMQRPIVTADLPIKRSIGGFASYESSPWWLDEIKLYPEKRKISVGKGFRVSVVETSDIPWKERK